MLTQDCLDDAAQTAQRASRPVSCDGLALNAVERRHSAPVDAALIGWIRDPCRQQCVQVFRGRLREVTIRKRSPSCFDAYQSAIHSQTLPIMSCTRYPSQTVRARCPS